MYSDETSSVTNRELAGKVLVFDIQLIPIEKVFSNRDSIRKAREAFLILKGRTLVPDGLNIREETYLFFYFYYFIVIFKLSIF